MLEEFLREMTHEGYRVFSVDDARAVSVETGLDPKSLPHILGRLKEKRLIRSLWRGHYAIEDNILSGSPLHKFEVAMHLAPNGAISCWSAMSYYGLTDQVLSKVYILAPYEGVNKRSLYKQHIDGSEFLLIQIYQNHFWGIKTQRIGEIKVRITDLERTLLDGLMRPQYCGGFREVMNAFLIARGKINKDLIIEYARRCPIAVQKRLGWMLENIGLEDVRALVSIPESHSIDKLDISAPRRGKHNPVWMVLENY